MEWSKFRKDPELKAALNDELYVLYGYKSMKWGFILAGVTALIVNVLMDVSVEQQWAVPMTGKLAINIVIYVSSVGSLIAKLIYMRK